MSTAESGAAGEAAIDRQARAATLSALPVALLEAVLPILLLIAAIIYMPSQYGGAGLLAVAGVVLIFIAAEVFLGLRLYGYLRPARYQSGVLTGRPWPELAFARLAGVVLLVIGFGLLTPMAVHLGLALALLPAALGAWLLLHAATSKALHLGEPVLRISDEGVWVDGMDGPPTPWARFRGLRPERGLRFTTWVLEPEPDAEGVAARPTLSPVGLDLTHADLLRAIARFQPRLLSF